MSKVKTQALPAAREPWVERLLDLLAGWLLTASMCMVVDAQFPTQAGFFTVLWHTAVVMAVLTLLTLRWWLLPTALGVGVAVTFFCLLPWANLTASLNTVKEFFLWWFANLPLDSPWYTPQTMYILHSLIHLGLSVLVFVMLRVFRRSWPLAALGGALQVFILLVASKDNSALSLGLYVSGIFPLLARDRYNGRRLFSKAARYRTLAPRWKISVATGVLFVLVSVAMLFALPGDTSELRVRFCSDGVADLQTITDGYLVDQKENTAITLHDMGLQPSIFRLGGNLEKLPSAVLATTNLTEPALVKVAAFDTFTGKNWTSTFVKGYRANGFWDKKQAEYLSSKVLQDEEWASKLALIGEKKPVTFTLTTPSFLLPTVGQTLSITEDVYAKSTLSFNERGELLTYTYPMTEGYAYTVETLDIPLDNAMEKAAYQAVVSVAMAGDDEMLADDAFYKLYTALPDNLSEENFQKIYDVTDGVTFQLEQVLMISRFFSEEAGYSYEEAPGKTGYNDNVVNHLFRTKKGYCVHYATAMAMMTRAIGVPSRLAVGYKTVGAPDGTQVVDASNPYVWVECYFKNLGWLSFDPTPGESFKKPISDMPDLPQNQQQNQKPDNPATQPEDPFVPQKIQKLFTEWWIIPVGLIGLALLFLVVRGLLSSRFYRLDLVRKRYFHNRQQAQHYYQDILRQLQWLGYPVQGGDTLYQLLDRFTATASQTAEGIAEDIHERLRPLVELHYAGLEPTDPQVDALAVLHDTLETAVRERLDVFRYLLFRRALLPRTNPVTSQYR